jgi:hypothetical protein
MKGSKTKGCNEKNGVKNKIKNKSEGNKKCSIGELN